ncbi:hypothetical protein EVAR_81611_1 [Eumeta japonica]|uniref:Uncharacterized protein n=1 Tax=Eumeta variegata TaxID=151549 RepID=A0A4C1WD83_EUMVA|nr:hypothetical protein EVAR_81611_1 [Eumeta japonica]
MYTHKSEECSKRISKRQATDPVEVSDRNRRAQKANKQCSWTGRARVERRRCQQMLFQLALCRALIKPTAAEPPRMSADRAGGAAACARRSNECYLRFRQIDINPHLLIVSNHITVCSSATRFPYTCCSEPQLFYVIDGMVA